MQYEFRGKNITEAVSRTIRAFGRPNHFTSAISAGFDAKAIQKQLLAFDFSELVHGGPVLFVGEGNLSFSHHLAKFAGLTRRNIVATVYENAESLSAAIRKIATSLRQLGARVIASADATDLAETFRKERFVGIVFQFPNVGSRTPFYGQNPNHVLATRYLKSAINFLTHDGVAIITTVDSPFYEGAFKIGKAATKAGYDLPRIFDFDPTDFPNYTHQNTANDESAIEQYDEFATWVCRRKPA